MPMEVLPISPPLPLLLHLPPLFRSRGMLLTQCCTHPRAQFKKSIFNPSAHATQNYNIVEYLAQAPCAMSMLEVLQNCPSQHRTLLSSIGVVDPEASNMIMFNLDYFKPRLSHHLAFQIQTMVHGKNIHRTLFWMKEPPLVSCHCPVREPLVLLNLTSLLPPLKCLMDMVSNLTNSCNISLWN
jgi:hypothetical protein